jgi:hypothetical protein
MFRSKSFLPSHFLSNRRSLALLSKSKQQKDIHKETSNMSLPNTKDSNKRHCSLKAILRKNGMRLAIASPDPEEQDNEEIVLLAVQQTGEALQFASERIRRGESENAGKS